MNSHMGSRNGSGYEAEMVLSNIVEPALLSQDGSDLDKPVSQETFLEEFKIVTMSVANRVNRRRRRRGTYLDNADARTQQHHRQHPHKTNEAHDWKVTKKTNECHEEDAQEDAAKLFREEEEGCEGHQ
ncbi:hypothetical protein JHK82_055284 [Glycine max]|nr:hypothetical protein JHK82_055284 [Glycine max]